MTDEKVALQIDLLEYWIHPKSFRGATKALNYPRKDLVAARNVLLWLEYLYIPNPDMHTSARNYRTSPSGRAYLKSLKGRDAA
jgi:hypothetical protein